MTKRKQRVSSKNSFNLIISLILVLIIIIGVWALQQTISFTLLPRAALRSLENNRQFFKDRDQVTNINELKSELAKKYPCVGPEFGFDCDKLSHCIIPDKSCLKVFATVCRKNTISNFRLRTISNQSDQWKDWQCKLKEYGNSNKPGFECEYKGGKCIPGYAGSYETLEYMIKMAAYICGCYQPNRGISLPTPRLQ